MKIDIISLRIYVNLFSTDQQGFIALVTKSWKAHGRDFGMESVDEVICWVRTTQLRMSQLIIQGLWAAICGDGFWLVDLSKLWHRKGIGAWFDIGLG